MWTNDITHTFASVPPVMTVPPRIFPNRLQIDDRFPSLGFTVDTAGQPFFEVILTTDRSLFDPANASRRTSSNFYSSREHSGLIQSVTNDAAVYTTPSAVLRGFAGAREIYYTAITYRALDLSNPVFATQIADLKTGAPSVSLAPGFQGRTLEAILSVPLERLQRIRHDGRTSDYTSSLASIDANADRAEGEDGYGLSLSEDWDNTFADSAEPNENWAVQQDTGGDSDWSATGESLASDDGYSDGFEGPIGSASGFEDQTRAYEDESDSYPAGPTATGLSDDEQFSASHEPATLEDTSYPYDKDPAPADGSSKTADYQDEAESLGTADDLDHDSPGYQALDAPTPTPTPARAPAPRKLDVPAKIDLIQQIAPFESGKDLYAAINADGEFEGKFPNHPATGKYHIGLSYGIIQFTQDSGSLGRLLTMMRDRDDKKFRQVFGADADELIRVTTAEGKPSKDVPSGRSVRVQPVKGADIWKEPWLSRFRDAARPDLFGKGNKQLFNGAQNELAALMYLDPMLRFASWLGLITDRALAMVFDRSVQMGSGGGKRWIIGAVGPIKTPAIRQQALSALGHADLKAFQSAMPGLDHDGAFGPETHAAVVSALRGIGSGSPVPIPTRDQMLDAMEHQAASTSWAKRTSQLRHSTVFTDAEFQI